MDSNSNTITTKQESVMNFKLWVLLLMVLFTFGCKEEENKEELNTSQELPVLADTVLIIEEESMAGAFVGNVTIEDTGLSGITNITLIGTGEGNFTVENNGSIYVSSVAEIDFSVKSSYVLSAIAESETGRSQSAEITIYVKKIGVVPAYDVNACMDDSELWGTVADSWETPEGQFSSDLSWWMRSEIFYEPSTVTLYYPKVAASNTHDYLYLGQFVYEGNGIPIRLSLQVRSDVLGKHPYFYIKYDGSCFRGEIPNDPLLTPDTVLTPVVQNFIFAPETNALISTFYTSNKLTISGLDTGSHETATLSSNSTASLVQNGEVLPTLSTTIQNGDELAVKLISSDHYETPVRASLTVGTYSSTYSITTQAAPVVDSVNTFMDGQ